MTARGSFSLLAALALAACASGAGAGGRSGSAGGRPAEMAYDGDGIFLSLERERRVSSHVLDASVDQVWPALARAYEGLGIPVTTVDRRSRILGNVSFTARADVARVPMTRLLDCGFGFSGPIAGQNRITFDLRSQVRAAGEGQAEVRTLVIATATPVEGTSNNPLPCTTTGALEALIAQHVEAAVR